eukprot:TRINITY_DN258_c0_g1_i6.p1 TRINITY_DN258_c0_g1~~TRINITY_DN258_c0_g1_i6.p1  ORF type:complete len:205 (-),score=62.18 TRINITY_DN258_c0_g1_i6:91-705(-)
MMTFLISFTTDESLNQALFENELHNKQREKNIMERKLILELHDPNSSVAAENGIDLLGGLTDDEEEINDQIFGNSNNHHRERQVKDDASDYSVESDRVRSSQHRNLPSRGAIDELVDAFFDRTTVGVSVKKNGRKDGVYLFGQRVIKVESDGVNIFVCNAGKKQSMSDFITKFEAVEIVRAKGLQSAIHVCAMAGRPIQNKIIV